MKNYFLYVFLVVSCITSFASDIKSFAPDFGSFSKAEDLIKYEKDSTAEAVYLFDRGDTYFRSGELGFKIIFMRTQRVKILRNAGIEYATFEIPYFVDGNKMEKVESISGFTYNLVDGVYEKTPLDIKTVYEEDRTINWKVKKFTMPNVREGSIVEILYSISSPYFFNIREWDFQKKIPVIYSEYVTHMVPFYTYSYILQGRLKCDEYKPEVDSLERTYYGIKFKDTNHSFVMKDLPAFKDEAYITCPEDFMIKLNFQLSEMTTLSGDSTSYLNTWDSLINELLKNPSLGGYLNNAKSNAAKTVAKMNISDKTTIEKISAIDLYMKSNFNWNGNKNKFTDNNVKKFLETKIGNTAEINLYYVAMLNSAGLDACPVLLSTRDNGKIKVDYPFEHFFNYVVAAIKMDEKMILLDATEPLINLGTLPERCINDQGLTLKKVLKNESVEWVQLKAASKSTLTYVVNLRPDLALDSVGVHVDIVSDGYYASRLRKKYVSDPEGFEALIIPANYRLRDSVRVRNLLEANKNLSFKYSAKVGLNIFDDKIAIAPFCSFVETVNPFRQAIRTYPIDMVFKNAKDFQTTIHIPNGYKVVHTPSAFQLNDEDFKLNISSEEVDGSTLKISGGYEFTQEKYSPDKYDKIKEYYRLIVTLFNDEVILQKI